LRMLVTKRQLIKPSENAALFQGVDL
jgi:hypothetical protein